MLVVPLPSRAALLIQVPAICTASVGSRPSGALSVKLPVVVRSSRTLSWPGVRPLVSGTVTVTRSLVPVSVTVSVVVLTSPSASVMV